MSSEVFSPSFVALVAVDERLLSGRPVGNCTGCEIEVEAGQRDKDRGASTFSPPYRDTALVASGYLGVYSHKPDVSPGVMSLFLLQV